MGKRIGGERRANIAMYPSYCCGRLGLVVEMKVDDVLKHT